MPTEIGVTFVFPTENLHPKYIEDSTLLGLELVQALSNEWNRDNVLVRLQSQGQTEVIEADEAAPPAEEAEGQAGESAEGEALEGAAEPEGAPVEEPQDFTQPEEQPQPEVTPETQEEAQEDVVEPSEDEEDEDPLNDSVWDDIDLDGIDDDDE